MHWVRYAWGVVVGLFNLVVILWVFSQVYEPRDKLIVAILGLIYTTMRSIALHQALYFTTQLTSIHLRLAVIERATGIKAPDLIDDDDDEMAETQVNAERMLRRSHARLYIDAVFIALAYLVCLYVVFTSLSDMRWRY